MKKARMARRPDLLHRGAAPDGSEEFAPSFSTPRPVMPLMTMRKSVPFYGGSLCSGALQRTLGSAPSLERPRCIACQSVLCPRDHLRIEELDSHPQTVVSSTMILLSHHCCNTNSLSRLLTQFVLRLPASPVSTIRSLSESTML